MSVGPSSSPEPLAVGAIEAFPGVYARTRRFTVGAPRNLAVLDDGRVLFLRSRSGEDPVLCLWVLEIGQGERLLVDPRAIDAESTDDADLPPAERARRERARESAGGIVSYTVDRVGRRACFGLAGSLFVVDLSTGRLVTPAIAGPVFDPRLSPDGSRVAYVSGADLRVVDLVDLVDRDEAGDPGDPDDPSGPGGGDRAVAVGGGTASWGRAEFIAAEEMQRSRGFWWAPTSDRLLVTRVDEARVQRWWIADPAHPDREPNEIRYPAAGTANAEVGLYLVDLAGSSRPIAWDEDSRYEYLADVVWSGQGPPLLVRQTRQQREVSIAELDVASGSVTERHTITDDVWVELIPSSPTPSRHGLLTVEDLSPATDDPDPAGPGRRALLLDGAPLTGADLNVRSIARVVDDRAIITAWTEPSEIHVFSVGLGADAGPPVRLSEGGGVHGVTIGGAPSDDTTQMVAVLTSARPASPRAQVTVHRFDGVSLGPVLASIDDLTLPSPLPALPTFCQLGPDRLETALFLPSGYDGSAPLPVLLDPYGGPHAQRVLKYHAPHLVSQWFAEQGFAVLVTDGRGTPGRGPAWEREVWGDLAEPVLTDQIEALDAAADEFDILDLDRVAIRGWSFGGYLAALAVLRRPDRFHAAVAGAPVTTWRLYDTHYTERYLGRPDLHARHYEQTDLLAEAANLTRPLLLIHGLADDNVIAAHTLRLSSALLAAGVPHQVLPLSGVTHMTPQEVVAENLLWLQLDFLRRSLGLVGGRDGVPRDT